jgi:hypothetical protein
MKNDVAWLVCKLFGALLFAAAVLAFGNPARAQTIKDPNGHPDYRVELEPHGTLALFHRDFYGYYGYGYATCYDNRGRPYACGGPGTCYDGAGRPYGCGGYSAFGSPDFGVGFRVSIKIVDPGFIPKLNNTVAISFGLDFTNCGGFCGGNSVQLYLPEGGLQWNFFFSDKFSAFADLGADLHAFGGFHANYFDFYAMLGGRYHFNKTVAITFRFGYPFITFGPSFFI